MPTSESFIVAGNLSTEFETYHSHNRSDRLIKITLFGHIIKVATIAKQMSSESAYKTEFWIDFGALALNSSLKKTQ